MTCSLRAMLGCLALIALADAACLTQPLPNLLPNPSFELVEPPAPTAQTLAGDAPADAWLPRTWNAWGQDGALLVCPDDPTQAHSGRRSVHFQADRGTGLLRYGPTPVPDDRPWHVAFQARGRGQVVAAAFDVSTDTWTRLQEWPFDLAEAWTEFALDFLPPAQCRQWTLELATRGATEARIDDALVTYPDLAPLGLPPDQPLARDDHTLLYLPFEEPLNEDAFFVRPDAHLSGEGEGRFGRGLVLGPEGYVACSANESLDPAEGTIEVWCKLLSPGNDGIARPIVTVPGPEGMWLGKDQYAHIGFSFSSGWRRLSGAVALGYAGPWQPGVWRHLAACWDKDLLQLFVDGKLIGWETGPKLSRFLGPELAIGSPGMELDDLRLSNVVRYRQLVPPDK